MKVYGYCRISRKEQNIERQERNIQSENTEANISGESYTGTKVEGRKQFEKLIGTAKAGDVIVFDSVSRMSRNAEEGVNLYEELMNRGIELVFLKEHHIDTSTYKRALTEGVPMTGTNVDIILSAVNEYLKALRKEQIRLAFEQAQKEVDDLHQRTREGIETARLNGKQIGGTKGAGTRTSKREAEAKAIILRKSREFEGTNSDGEVMKLAGIARNTFYKYKRELKDERQS